MAVQNIPRPADEGASEPLLDAAAALLRERWREMSPDFIVELYAHAAADDLDRYTPDEIAAIGEDAWSFLLERTPGAPKIAFTPARLTPGVMVLNILNDDMP
ncbi:MAG: hypothetical protein ACREFC_03535, partial [Stellaceae bacterium]